MKKMLVCVVQEKRLEGTIRTEGNSSKASRALTVSDLTVKVRYRKGDTIEIDCSCDSEYMPEAIQRVGKFIRNIYHWVPRTVKVLYCHGQCGWTWDR